VSVVNGVSFSLERGGALCLLGESGSGKSVTLRSLIRLFPPTARIGGKIRIGDVDVLSLGESELRQVGGTLVSMIFQEPMTALDPVFTIGQQIAETVVYGVSKADANRRALELLEMVQVPSAKRRLEAYPHELSGGLRQRAMIALALACRPQLLLADETTRRRDDETTRRRRRSMPPSRSRSFSCCASYSGNSAWRRFSSRTTSVSPARSRTGWR